MGRSGLRASELKRLPARFLGIALVAGAWTGVFGSVVDDAIVLEETASPDEVTACRIELKASGLYRPPLPPEAMTPDAKMPKPLDVDIQTRMVYRERLLKGPQRRSLRLVRQAASAINGEVRPAALELRPELSLLIAERRVPDGAVTVASPSGSLTRGELELVESLGDSLCLTDLLPEGPTAQGKSWPIRKSALWALTGYDAITSTTVEGVIESVADDRVRIGLKGEVKGSVLGAEGTLTCEGWFTFDRKAGLIDGLELNRTESRQPGAVEAGLDLKSTLTIARRAGIEVPSELSDASLAALSPDLTPGRLLLQLIAPDGRYNLLHERNWHIYWDDKKLVVLKRYEKGRVTAQCNLVYGPPAGKGKHQDVESFREDVKRALKGRFSQFLGAGEVEGDPEGGFRYKLGVQGRQDDLGLLWYYYLIASPRGEQLLATFTLIDSDAPAFGQEDERIIGSLQWNDPPLAVGR
ncbi:hypothetical protein [Planctomyces sp. SH-PL62]|uniref:hypothetical protein n=1 Tax=Planctomyces sp. SH-PL62 TaxID=1636152 RepID=UPI00078E3C3A|nr:hypothetical protein [Planctomyces sp. SH-PL62]AMV36392.1 hypothetical protein VT85_03075 [Planctomyces sp. SH-PL62]